jgi:hypothetical protein
MAWGGDIRSLRRSLSPPTPLGRLALGLGGDLFQLAALHGRQGLARRALFGIAEGPAIGLHPLLDRAEELAFPARQGNARLVGGALGPLQGVDGGAFGRLSLDLERAFRRLLARAAARTESCALKAQISPRADMYRSRIASSSWRLALSCFLMRMTLRKIFTS